jgi:hypothetical protein
MSYLFICNQNVLAYLPLSGDDTTIAGRFSHYRNWQGRKCLKEMSKYKHETSDRITKHKIIVTSQSKTVKYMLILSRFIRVLF